jgi:RNA polymerase sigma-70 factor (ECF subfamily)
MTNGERHIQQTGVEAERTFFPFAKSAYGQASLNEAAMNERKLVHAAQGGDAAAFVSLCKLHSDKILRRLYRITKNWEDAEDALQDAFLKAYLNLRKFEGRSSFSSWLTRIAINSALMLLRKKRSRNETPIEISAEGDPFPQQREVVDPAESPERRYVQCERRERLGKAIPRLRPCFRSVVELYHFEDRSTAEIADALGISVPAVKSRLLRAKTALRRTMVRKPPVMTNGPESVAV